MSAETLRPDSLLVEGVTDVTVVDAEGRIGAPELACGEPALLNRMLAVSIGIFAIPVLVEAARLLGAAAVEQGTQLWSLLAVGLLALGFSWLSWGPGGSSATLRLARTLSLILAAEAGGLALALALRFA
ncbi:MAG: hypothetical protein OEP95_10275 [Myxococcales bacterium]|nr:hypothetical protein [Myxococcales bacterium]